MDCPLRCWIELDWTYVDETDRVLRPVVAFGEDSAVG